MSDDRAERRAQVERLRTRSQLAGMAIGVFVVWPLLWIGTEVSAWLAAGLFVLLAVLGAIGGVGFAAWHTNKTVPPMDLGPS